jgi:flagellar hook-length control protein FliK
LPQGQSAPATAAPAPKIDLSQVADASTTTQPAPQQVAAETAPVEVPVPVIASAKPKAAIVPDSKDGDKPERGKEAAPGMEIAATSLPDIAPQPQPQMAATPQPPVAAVALQIVAVSPQQAGDAQAPASAEQSQSVAEAGTTAPRAARAGTQTAALPEAPAAPPHHDTLPATLFSQALSQHAQPDQLLAGIAYAPDKTESSTAVVRARAGQMGRDMGAVIARQLVDGREQVTVRLTPPDMGRVDVRLSFDHDKGLRAIVATETPAAMDLLRRDMGDLNRALADAGVRTDANSFRFDSRHSGSGFAQPDHGRQNPQGHSSASPRQARAGLDGDQSADLAYRPLRASGGIDMIA